METCYVVGCDAPAEYRDGFGLLYCESCMQQEVAEAPDATYEDFESV